MTSQLTTLPLAALSLTSFQPQHGRHDPASEPDPRRREAVRRLPGPALEVNPTLAGISAPGRVPRPRPGAETTRHCFGLPARHPGHVLHLATRLARSQSKSPRRTSRSAPPVLASPCFDHHFVVVIYCHRVDDFVDRPARQPDSPEVEQDYTGRPKRDRGVYPRPAGSAADCRVLPESSGRSSEAGDVVGYRQFVNPFLLW